MNEIALKILEYSGFSTLARRVLTRNGRFVLELHGIVDRQISESNRLPVPTMSGHDLSDLLEWLRPRFRLLTVEEFLSARIAGVLLTFDDGFANQAEVALPVLEAYGAPAVFFVTTCHVADPHDWLPAGRKLYEELVPTPTDLATAHALFDGMSIEQLGVCAQSPFITIGSHTVSHPLLSECSHQQLEHELKESKRFLEQYTGQVVEFFAYPTGDYDVRVATAVRAAGYKAAFVEDSQSLGLGCFEISRVGLYQVTTDYLSAKLSGLHRSPHPVDRNRTTSPQ